MGKPKVHYVIKRYNTKEEYETEKLMLDKLSDSKVVIILLKFSQIEMYTIFFINFVFVQNVRCTIRILCK